MSEQVKQRLAQELGVADKVQNGNWGNVSSRDCGNIVKLAIQYAERQMSGRQ
jgi:small acid-soluble spore protein F (minor alpha/beta-type SASP)